MIKDIINGILAYFKAFGLISKLKLWRYFAIPILISILTAISVITAIYFFSGSLGTLMAKAWVWEWGATAVAKATSVAAAILIVALALILYKHIVMALSAPFMSPVSEKIETHLTGKTTHNHRQTSFQQQLARGIRINMRNLSKELLFTIPLILLSLIPVLGFFTTALIFVLQAYYAGYGNMDYTMERHFDYKNSVQFVRKHRGIALGNGVPFILMLFIPIFGFIITLPVAVTAASIETVKQIEKTATSSK